MIRHLQGMTERMRMRRTLQICKRMYAQGDAFQLGRSDVSECMCCKTYRIRDMIDTIGVAFITHITHVRNMRKVNIYNKVALT